MGCQLQLQSSLAAAASPPCDALRDVSVWLSHLSRIASVSLVHACLDKVWACVFVRVCIVSPDGLVLTLFCFFSVYPGHQRPAATSSTFPSTTACEYITIVLLQCQNISVDAIDDESFKMCVPSGIQKETSWAVCAAKTWADLFWVFLQLFTVG